ncbi:MAG: glycosyltransferase [Methanobacteriota archaeon]
MRIGMFTDSYLPTRDGVVTSLTTSRRILEAMGHEVFLFAPDDPRGKAPKENRTYYFPASEFSQYEGYRVAIYPARGLHDIIRENDIDVLHTHGVAFMGFKSMFASRFFRIPILLTYHTMITEAFHYMPWNLDEDLMRRLMWIYLRHFLARADGVVAPTHAILAELEAEAKLKYTAVIPTGVDLERFNPRGTRRAEIRERLGMGVAPMVLHVGRVAREKNLDTIIAGFPSVLKRHPDAKLVVAGDGPAREGCERLVKANGMERSVVFAGFVPDEELPGYYSAADAFVIASKFETQGIVVMEAMASGLPVAGINFRAIPEMIKDGENGYLFDESSEGCAAAICRALDAPENIKQKALETAGRFEERACTKMLVETYEELIKIGV